MIRGAKMNIIEKMLPYLLVCALAFCIIPFMGIDTGGLIILLLVVFPIICLLSSLIYGIKNGFHLLFSLLVAVLFLPNIFISLNSSASIYPIAYTTISIVGNFAGSLFFKRGK